jgi:hypothetical protein
MEHIMTSEPNNNPSPGTETAGLAAPPKRRLSTRLMTTVAIVGVLAVGAIGGAGASRFMHRHWPEAVLLLQPAPIAQLKDATPVAIKGQVAEVFGNKFIVQDDSGRTLVDTGPRGDSAKPVAKGETVTVQGRFDNGFIRAQVMTRADGTNETYGPPRGPGHGPRHGGPEGGPRDGHWGGPGDGPGEGRGMRADRGPGRGPGFERGPGLDRAPDTAAPPPPPAR